MRPFGPTSMLVRACSVGDVDVDVLARIDLALWEDPINRRRGTR
jgi:hypothetical protein